MTPDDKLKIVDAANNYLEEKQISQADLAKLANVNQAYLSSMLKGKFVFENGTVVTDIQDKWFKVLAEGIGYQWNKNYWPVIQTAQFKEVLFSLEMFRNNRRSGAIICDTGMGKTHSIDRFVTKHPGNTIRITVSKLHRLRDIVFEIADKLNLHPSGMFTCNVPQVNKLIHEFRWMHRRGENPILIIDEAENLQVHVFGMIKALYDGVSEFCPIILIGTQELEDKMLRMKLKNKPGMPQFYRRFKAGVRYISPARQFDLFYAKHQVEKPLQKLLNSLCENYGEMHDYLEPVLRYADETKKPLNEQIFRLYHNMPNN